MRGPTLRLVCVNDVYALDNLPRLRTLVRHLREAAPDDALITTLAGDFISPSLLSSLDHGAAMVDCLNAVPVTHVCFGNHEQDVPFEELVERVRAFRGTWLNTNMPGFEPALPSTQELEVSAPDGRTVRVGLVGVVTADATLYPPDAFGGLRVLPANGSVLAAATALANDGCVCTVALTHQSLDDDRALATAQGRPPVPLIVGGHEHEVHIEKLGSAWIVKAGAEAAYAAVVELVWPAEAPPAGAADLPRVAVRLEPLRAWADDPAMRELVAARMRPVKALQDATLLRLPPDTTLSSRGTRVRQTSLGAMFASGVRDALGVEACLINGGGIRGDRDYEGVFTYGDLEAELPFANEVVVASMPGRVVRDAIAASRSHAPRAAPGFLQVDDAVTVDAAHQVTAIAGAPFDPARDYRVATVRVLFDGMDGIAPLLRFAREHPERVPARDSGRELKIVLLDALARSLWQSLGRFEELDADDDLRVSADELRAAIRRSTHAPPVVPLVDGILRTLDADRDGYISRGESDAD